MMGKIQSLNADFEESDDLTEFIAYLNGFNKGITDNTDNKSKFQKMERTLIEFFEYKWENDHNQFVASEGD